MRTAAYWVLIVWGVLAFHAPQVWLLYFLLFPQQGSGGAHAALFNGFLILAWGGIHSLLARDCSHKIMARLVGEDFVKILYVSIAGLTQCVWLYLWKPLAGDIWQAQGLWWWILTGLALACMGAVFISSLLLDYMEALGIRTIIRRMKRQTREHATLSLRGPYAYCRHPVYFFTLLFIWVGPTMNSTKLVFSILGSLYVIIGMFLEDRDTARTLGQDYTEYKKHVPILIPRLTPWRPETGPPQEN